MALLVLVRNSGVTAGVVCWLRYVRWARATLYDHAGSIFSYFHVFANIMTLFAAVGSSFLIFSSSSASGKDIPYEIVARREGDVAEIYADVSLAQKELGWKATRTLGAYTFVCVCVCVCDKCICVHDCVMCTCSRACACEHRRNSAGLVRLCVRLCVLF